MDLLSSFFAVIILVQFVYSEISFDQWQAKYNVNYLSNPNDYEICKQSFDVNVAFTTVNKLRYNFGYELGLNGLADLASQQFKKTRCGIVLPHISERGNRVIKAVSQQPLVGIGNSAQVSTPASVDYRNSSLPVQNQKLCNSCWAFSVIESLGKFLMTYVTRKLLIFKQSFF